MKRWFNVVLMVPKVIILHEIWYIYHKQSAPAVAAQYQKWTRSIKFLFSNHYTINKNFVSFTHSVCFTVPAEISQLHKCPSAATWLIAASQVKSAPLEVRAEPTSVEKISRTYCSLLGDWFRRVFLFIPTPPSVRVPAGYRAERCWNITSTVVHVLSAHRWPEFSWTGLNAGWAVKHQPNIDETVQCVQVSRDLIAGEMSVSTSDWLRCREWWAEALWSSVESLLLSDRFPADTWSERGLDWAPSRFPVWNNVSSTAAGFLLWSSLIYDILLFYWCWYTLQISPLWD